MIKTVANGLGRGIPAAYRSVVDLGGLSEKLSLHVVEG